MQHSGRYRTHDRIAILGAGPSGLVIATELKKRGFHNVVLFERNAQVGGKVTTLWRNGHPTELGAVWVPRSYLHTRSLVEEHGLNLDIFPAPVFIKSDDRMEPLRNALYRKCGSRRAALMQMWRITRLASAIDRTPGLSHIGNEFAEPFEQFVHRRGVIAVAEAARPLAIACGYAYYETVPAAYILKHVAKSFRIFLHQIWAEMTGRCRDHGLMIVREGFQTLWQRITDCLNFDVRLGATIKSISVREDNSEGIMLRLADETCESFDCVFVTSPASSWPHLFDARLAAERRLTQIKSIVYRSLMVKASGLPHHWTCLPAANSYPHSGPHVIAIGNYCSHTNFYVLYQILPAGCSNERADGVMRADLEALGASQVTVEMKQEWPHFPHVSPADFAAGFHRNLEEHQGRHGVFLAGSLLNGESVEHAIEYSKYLVRRFFAQHAAGRMLSRRR
jgi:hypothetical protein